METVLYEYNGYTFSSWLLIPVVLIAFGVLLYKDPEILLINKHRKTLITDDEIRKTRYNVRIWLGGVIFMSLLTTIWLINDYRDFTNSYNIENIRTTSGYVENFYPMPSEGHRNESFTLNSVYFSYSDYSNTQGYHNARSKGGVITGNGQHLEIKYMKYKGDNIILSIKQLP